MLFYTFLDIRLTYIDERRVLWNSRKLWNTEVSMNYSRRTPMMQRSKKRSLVVVVPFSIDQSVFCDLQEFFQQSFQILNLTSTHVIWTLMLIIMFAQIIVVCYALVVF